MMRIPALAASVLCLAGCFVFDNPYDTNAGALDTSFLATGAGAGGEVISIAVQSDGKILIGGNFASYNGTNCGDIARLNTDGSLDASLLATGAGTNNAVSSVAVQSDGRILIGGAFTYYNGTNRGYVARLNADGSLDNLFPLTGPGANNTVTSVAVQSNSQILIGGVFTSYNLIGRGHVARLNADGSLDNSFLATGAGANNTVTSIAVQSDGRILIAGGFTTYNGISRGYVARLNTDGSLDTSFLGSGAGANGYMHSVAEQSVGTILIGGNFTTYNGTNRGYVARLNADGSLDTSFLGSGAGANGTVYSAVAQSAGKVLIGGAFTTCNGTSRGSVARLFN